jgi:hypothetical protein
MNKVILQQHFHADSRANRFQAAVNLRGVSSHDAPVNLRDSKHQK